MKFLDCAITDETYTHIENTVKPTVVTVINTSQAVAWVKRTHLEVSYVGVTDEYAGQILKRNGVNMDHVERLTASDLKRPILFLDWGDGTQVLADGNHRYMLAHRLKRKDIRCWIVERKDWQQFVVEGIPPQLYGIMIADVMTSVK